MSFVDDALEQVGELFKENQALRGRAERAEAAIERVREILPYLDGQIIGLEGVHPIVGATFRKTFGKLLAALEPPEGQADDRP